MVAALEETHVASVYFQVYRKIRKKYALSEGYRLVGGPAAWSTFEKCRLHQGYGVLEQFNLIPLRDMAEEAQARAKSQFRRLRL